MMNFVFHRDSVAELLERRPCQYFGRTVGIVELCDNVIVYRGHYVPVAECPRPFLAAVDDIVFEFCFVAGTKTENPTKLQCCPVPV